MSILEDGWTVSGIRETKKTDKKKTRKGHEFSTQLKII